MARSTAPAPAALPATYEDALAELEGGDVAGPAVEVALAVTARQGHQCGAVPDHHDLVRRRLGLHDLRPADGEVAGHVGGAVQSLTHLEAVQLGVEVDLGEAGGDLRR